MKYADYIKEIEIDALWGGSSELCSPEHQRSVRKHVKWTLDPHVNILSGVNGDGKSTILRRAITGARAVNAYEDNGIRVKTEPADAEYVRYNWISTPDVRSEYDENLQEFVKRYNAQLTVQPPLTPPKGENSLSSGEVSTSRQTQLFDIIDRLFAATHKTIDREAGEFRLLFWGEPLDLKVLSSGEKQMLTILLAVYLENEEPYVLFMDEPEVSLHIEWQKQLIGIIRKLNPNVQIILSTHSPAMIMDGWMDKVTEVSEISD
ncbi:MAG: ATP-binding protein [Prevotella sp.]|nr:ATP-binding protein [Prevotella sp.]